MSRVFNLRNRDIVVAAGNTEDTKVNTSTIASESSEAEVEMAAIEVNEMLVQALTAMRPVIGELPSFSGASNALPEEFTTKFKQYANVNGWDEEKMMQVVPLCLKDSALTWFDSLDEDSEERVEWESFKNALINRYHDKSKDLNNFQLFSTRKQKYKEDVQTYITEMKKLARNVRDKSLLNESVKVMIILNNLLPNIKLNIQLSEIPRTVAALESRAIIVENAYNSMESEEKSHNNNRFGNRNSKNRNKGNSGKQHDGAAGGVTDKHDVVCYGCGEPGHIKPNCPNPNKQKEVGTGKKEVECYSCKKAGHISRNCPDNQVNIKEEKSLFSL